MMERLEDIELNAIADARKDEPVVRVELDDL
jgi:antitoxin StbD